MFNSIVEKINQLEPELNLSANAIRKLIPHYYTERIVGFAGRKLFADQIRLFISLRNSLASSPRLSPMAVSEMLSERARAMKENFSVPETQFDQWIADQDVNANLHAYLITETKLILRQCLCVIGLIPNRRDIELFFDDASVFLPYLRSLSSHCSNLEDDLEMLRASYKALLPPIELPPEDKSWFNTVRKQLRDDQSTTATMLNQLSATNSSILANYPTTKVAISQVHYTNIPWLVLDILRAQGHSGAVTDGPGDGNRDIITELNGQQYFAQIKCHRFPPVSEQMVRSFAETCRTYNCNNGIFVTTYRFSRSAASGQWAIRNEDHPLEERIASIELIDMERLIELVIQLKIGISPAGYIDRRYWTDMQIAGFRRAQKGGSGVV